VATPYVTPEMLQNAPTGLPWDTIPLPQSTLMEQLAEQTNIAWRATGEVDSFCNQPLRATLDVEEDVGPEFRLTVKNGLASMIMSRWPVVQIIGAQVSGAATLPPQWTSIPATMLRTRTALIGTYGTSTPGLDATGPAQIDVGGGYVNWYMGRQGYRLQIAYINGWPHTSLTANATAGTTLFHVDDVTGLAGATAFIYDGGETETVQVASVTATNPVTVMGVSVPVGPGTATLATGTAHSHNAGIVVSALPQVVQWATILFAAAQVLTEGAMTYNIQSVRGTGGSAEREQTGLRTLAHGMLKPFKRVI